MLSPKRSNFFPIDFIAVFSKTIAQHAKWFAFYASIYLDVSGKMKTSCDSNSAWSNMQCNNSLYSVLLHSNASRWSIVLDAGLSLL